jgi:hypothetical protein
MNDLRHEAVKMSLIIWRGRPRPCISMLLEDIIRAEDLVLKRYMKPIDSIQLAIALNLRRGNITFVASDRRLCKIALEEGLDALTP